MRTLFLLKNISIIALVMLLAGCSTISINANFKAAPQLNSDMQHKSLPVEVRIYQLRDQNAFTQATFRELWQQDQAVLGNSLVHKQVVTVNPDSRVITSVSCSKECNYLGVVAIFRKPEADNWRVLYRIPKGASVLKHTMDINLVGSKIVLR